MAGGQWYYVDETQQVLEDRIRAVNEDIAALDRQRRAAEMDRDVLIRALALYTQPSRDPLEDA